MKNYFISFIICTLFFANAWAQNKNVLQSNNGVWIGIDDQAVGKNFAKAIAHNAIVSWSTDDKKYTQIATVTGAENSSQFENAIGKDLSKQIVSAKKMNSITMLWQDVEKNATADYFNIYALNDAVPEALGKLYKHKFDTKDYIGKTVFYKVALFKNGNLVSERKENIKIETKFNTTAPILYNKVETDSMVSLHWKATNKGMNNLMFANVYKMQKNSPVLVGKTSGIARKNSDTISLFYTETVLPNNYHSYFIVPTNYAGFEGEPSETANLVSFDFNSIPQCINLKAVDTPSGIYLSFTPPPASPLIAGIIIEKSRNDKQGYIGIDTVEATATNYLDINVVSNVTYYYQLRTIGIRPSEVLPSTWAEAIHIKGSATDIAPPLNIAAVGKKEGTLITWEPQIQMNNAGFRVYRNNGFGTNMEQIGLLITDKQYLDTATLDNRRKYTYHVTALSFNNIESSPSKKVTVSPNSNIIAPVAPNGIVANSSYGRVLLQWNDEKQNNGYIVGYNLYRKKLNANEKESDKEWTTTDLSKQGFEKINTALIKTNSFEDTKQLTADAYLYYVSSVDTRNIESKVSNGITTKMPKQKLMPPVNFTARYTSKGVVLTWDKNQQDGISGYTIYKRDANAKKATAAGQANGSTFTYTDKTNNKGKTIYYSIASKNGATESEQCLEKGVYCN